jgi:hypothetical protein
MMDPGFHTAEIKVWTSSGEEFKYLWAFQIAE